LSSSPTGLGSVTGSNLIDVTQYMPKDAQRVMLSRYQIHPVFPELLSEGWSSVAFNLSRPVVAHMSLIPTSTPNDGKTGPLYGGAAVAGGRIEFEPPVIVANPGQSYVQFLCRATPGNNQNQVYYRVDWDIQGDNDDLENYLEATRTGTQNSPSTLGVNAAQASFSTWHVASAALAQISFVLVILAAFLSLLL